MAAESVSNRAFWNERTSSGSSRSESVVNPDKSANSTVTGRRSASCDGSAGFWGFAGLTGVFGLRAAPQRGQNAKSGSHGKPHAAQGLGSRRPHRGQNAKPGAASVSQPGQVIISDDSIVTPAASSATRVRGTRTNRRVEEKSWIHRHDPRFAARSAEA